MCLVVVGGADLLWLWNVQRCNFFASIGWKCIYFVSEIGERVSSKTSLLEWSNKLGSKNALLKKHFPSSRKFLIERGRQTQVEVTSL